MMKLRSLLAAAAGAFLAGFPVSAFAASAPTVTRLTLIDAAAQHDLRTLVNGSAIVLSVDGNALNVRADASGTVGSVVFDLDGSGGRTENAAPYAFAADDDGHYHSWTPAVGTHTIHARPYSLANGKGTAGATFQVTFTVAKTAAISGSSEQSTPLVLPPTNGAAAVTQLVLINTATQHDLRSLANGSAIVLSVDGKSLNVRADVTGTLGSVVFKLDGATPRTENVAPYAFAADNSGTYEKWTPSVGSHTLRATPYSLKDGKGSAGTALEVAFTVTDQPVVVVTPPPIIIPPVVVTPPPVVTPPDLPSDSEPVQTSTAHALIYQSNGQLNLSNYGTLALSYDKGTMEKRFGPSFQDLNPNASDDRPTLYRPPSIPRTWGYIRSNPYEIGSTPVKDSDYWSDAGQLGYVPDVQTDPGLDRIQTYAYYDSVYSISPRLDWTNKQPHPDLQTREPYYTTLFGQPPKYPIAMVRNYGMQQNEQLTIYRDGYLAVNGTQTSRSDNERPFPGFIFPPNKVPTGIAVTTANEFALVTIWDINTHQGQLAVFALEGKYLPFHTWPYMGLPNQGSWSAFKLLGYVDLPMTTPTAVAAASNAWWSGPSQTGGLVLSQINLANDGLRSNVYSGGWKGIVATGGYAIVSSLYDGKAAIVDLTPLFTYMRESYLSSAASFNATMAARGTGDADFPQAFSVNSSSLPKVVWETTIADPTCVLAGQRLERWTRDYFKAYVAARDGTIRIIDTSAIMQRYSWEKHGTLGIVGSFNVGHNPVSMCFTRRGDGNLPLLPVASDGNQVSPDILNNLFYVAVRGDRKVVAAVTFQGQGAVYRTIKDARMGDPVAVSTAVRGPILSVADFRGKKMISFRIGKITDLRHNKVYGAGADGTAPFEFAGELPFAGYPFLLNSTNVN